MPSVLLSVEPKFLPLLVLPVAAACGSATPAAPVAVAPLPSPPASASSSDAGAAAPRDELAAKLCAGRAPCGVRRARPAGQGDDGKKLTVVSLDLGMRTSDGAAPAPGEVQESDLEETANEDTTGARFGEACHQYEYWLVVDGSAPQLLASACNDGHGASGVGQDVMTVGENSFTRFSSGGSSWRWATTNELSLSPLRFKASETSGYWSLGTNTYETKWDWARFAGHASWFSPKCGPNGEAPDRERGAEPAYAYELIPKVTLDESFRTGGFRDAALGACAVDIDGTGTHGVVTFGEKADRAEASLRAVLSNQDELFVEVKDAHPSGASARWVADDHLEIWLSTDAMSYWDHCLDNPAAPRQWGVRVADGKVFAGFGAPRVSDLAVERVAKDGVVRFKVRLPKDSRRITLAYSDGDGKKQRRLFATSEVKKNAPETLGEAFEVKPERAVCKVQEGRLEPVITREVKHDAPFADDF